MRVLSSILFFSLTMTQVFPEQKPDSLEALRNEIARNFFEAAPHIALAKYHVNMGNRLLAFHICEEIRRNLIPRNQFDEAFFKAFPILPTEGEPLEPIDSEEKLKEYIRRYPDSPQAILYQTEPLIKENPEAAKKLLEAGIQKYPKVGMLYFQLGRLVQEREDLKAAEALFVKAAELDTQSEVIQSWVGRFFLKVKNEYEKALPYYLTAYFLNPHAYESEYVESRIYGIASKIVNSTVTSTKPQELRQLLRHADPAIVDKAIDLQKEDLGAEELIELMHHDCRTIRWKACELLKNQGAKLAETIILELLESQDLRLKGLAAYLWINRKGPAGFKDIDPLLTSETQLLQFDTVSALLLEGGEDGKKHLKTIPKDNLHPRVAAMLTKSLEQKKPE